MIYKEPYHQNNFKKKLQKIESKIKALEGGDKAQNRTNIKEAVDSIEQLKSFIPDQEGFKKVVELFTRKLN